MFPLPFLLFCKHFKEDLYRIPSIVGWGIFCFVYIVILVGHGSFMNPQKEYKDLLPAWSLEILLVLKMSKCIDINFSVDFFGFLFLFFESQSEK